MEAASLDSTRRRESNLHRRQAAGPVLFATPVRDDCSRRTPSAERLRRPASTCSTRIARAASGPAQTMDCSSSRMHRERIAIRPIDLPFARPLSGVGAARGSRRTSMDRNERRIGAASARRPNGDRACRFWRESSGLGARGGRGGATVGRALDGTICRSHSARRRLNGQRQRDGGIDGRISALHRSGDGRMWIGTIRWRRVRCGREMAFDESCMLDDAHHVIRRGRSRQSLGVDHGRSNRCYQARASWLHSV